MASEPERRTFVAAGRGLINSTELRATKFDVPENDALPKLVLRRPQRANAMCQAKVTRTVGGPAKPFRQIPKFILTAKNENTILDTLWN